MFLLFRARDCAGRDPEAAGGLLRVPNLVEDRLASKIETITLSYTFFDSSAYSGPRDRSVAQTGVQGAANSATPG
jgi:hypothetical protein